MDGVVGAIQSSCLKGLVLAGSPSDFFPGTGGGGESLLSPDKLDL